MLHERCQQQQEPSSAPEGEQAPTYGNSGAFRCRPERLLRHCGADAPLARLSPCFTPLDPRRRCIRSRGPARHSAALNLCSVPHSGINSGVAQARTVRVTYADHSLRLTLRRYGWKLLDRRLPLPRRPLLAHPPARVGQPVTLSTLTKNAARRRSSSYFCCHSIMLLR